MSKKRRGAEVRDRRKKQRVRTKEVGKSYRKGLRGYSAKASAYGEKKRVDNRMWERRSPVNHLRGKMERRVDHRRWRAGRVDSRRGGRERMKKGKVERLEVPETSLRKKMQGEMEGWEQVEVGDGRKIKEEYWMRRKKERRRKQYGTSVAARNGRTRRAYRRVDYRIGRRRVRREPRSGEVRRPQRIERCRRMRRK